MERFEAYSDMRPLWEGSKKNIPASHSLSSILSMIYPTEATTRSHYQRKKQHLWVQLVSVISPWIHYPDQFHNHQPLSSSGNLRSCSPTTSDHYAVVYLAEELLFAASSWHSFGAIPGALADHSALQHGSLHRHESLLSLDEVSDL